MTRKEQLKELLVKGKSGAGGKRSIRMGRRMKVKVR